MLCMPRRKHSKRNDDLSSDTKHFHETKKLLLLGTGESGKTTIIKQMKILHINGYSNDERKEKIPYIRQNIHESIYDIIYNMDKIEPPIDFNTESIKLSAQYILDLAGGDATQIISEYTDEFYDHVSNLWHDPNVKAAFDRSNEYQLIDSAGYFLDRLDTIRTPDYIPTTQDILHCRIKTISITEIAFSVPVPRKYGGGGNTRADFIMYDVGGQRGERKKWIQVFDGIHAVLFLIAASDFDQTLREDHTRNRLDEAYAVFGDIYRSRFVRDAGLIVFLNKQDLLRTKIEMMGRQVERYFPDYATYRNVTVGSEYERARLYMRQKIMDIASEPLTVEYIGFIPGKNICEKLPPRDVYVHFTVATDTDNVKKVFESVHDIILKKNWTNILY